MLKAGRNAVNNGPRLSLKTVALRGSRSLIAIALSATTTALQYSYGLAKSTWYHRVMDVGCETQTLVEQERTKANQALAFGGIAVTICLGSYISLSKRVIQH